MDVRGEELVTGDWGGGEAAFLVSPHDENSRPCTTKIKNVWVLIQQL